MPDSVSRLEMVMLKVCDALEENTRVVKEQTGAIELMAEANRSLADAIREQIDADDRTGADLSRGQPDDDLPWEFPGTL